MTPAIQSVGSLCSAPVRLVPMLIGVQVRQTGGFLAGLRRAEEMGAEVVQLFPQNNRQWRLPDDRDETYAAYRERAEVSPVVNATVCHAPYLINLISPNLVTEARSLMSLIANLRAATALGAFGLVLHPGSHRGMNAATAAARIGRRALVALDEAMTAMGVCQLLFENTAGAGGTVGSTFADLAAIIDAAGGDPRLGVCLDTQHLWASGIEYTTPTQADSVVRQLATEIGLDRLRCLHLNDSKVPCGARRDRHENLGLGTIGVRPLRSLLGHPDLQDVPAILEVPGIEGKGPGPADLAIARSLHEAGLDARRRHARNLRRRSAQYRNPSA
jgi:deoxyribonuclease IV